MSDPQELAALIRDVLHDRLENSSKEHLAFETASLRAFLYSALDSLDHMRTHVQRHEIHNTKQMEQMLTRLITRLENSMLNLEDVRLELKDLGPNEC